KAAETVPTPSQRLLKDALDGFRRAGEIEFKPPEKVIKDALDWSRTNVETATKSSKKTIETALRGLRQAIDPTGPDNLQDIVELCQNTPASAHLQLDPSLARGLSYYTGAIMEVTVPDLTGSLGGGGRYDNLIGMFLGRDVPACGFSLGLERIIYVMTERGMFPESVVAAPVDVMVTVWNEQS